MSKYVSEFLTFKCAGDVINAVQPVAKMAKEITEAMAIRKAIRGLVLAFPDKITVFDMGAGNGLAGILAAFTLPVKWVTAIDKEIRVRQGFSTVRKWDYRLGDVVMDSDIVDAPCDSLIIASHPCGDFAEKLVDLYNGCGSFLGLVMIPCCVGSKGPLARPVPALLGDKLNPYERWCLKLYERLASDSDNKVNARRDNNIVSPANVIISAWRR